MLARIFPDPRIPILLLLTGYLALGFTVLGFNRSPDQVLITSAAACLLELFLMRVFRGKFEFPLSALITSLGLSILLNYSHDYSLLVVPVFFAIGLKYVFTFEGRHVYNPAMIGVVLSLLTMNELITSAPAYQWNGLSSMAYFIAFPALMFFMPSIDRTPLVLSFLVTFTLQTALRAWIMRHHLPFDTLFWGTLSSPSFLLFTFFMITDPKTSPSNRRQQIFVGVALALLDLSFHLRKSYYTFFYAAFTLATLRLIWWHAQASWKRGSPLAYLREKFLVSGYYRRPALLGAMALAYFVLYQRVLSPSVAAATNLHWSMAEIPASTSRIRPVFGNVFDRTDPRMSNILKWLLSIGDSVATGDYDEDGYQDLFFTFPLKSDADRLSLYRNRGGFAFDRVALPAVERRAREIETYGLPTNAMFVDYDGDGDLDLLVTYAFGSPLLLKNLLRETGKAEFKDVTRESGLEHYANSSSANFLDVNRDGRLDLIIGNVLPSELPDYPTPTRLNFFRLPQPETPGDKRMFNFMHASWNSADNGGHHELYLQGADGRFQPQNGKDWGFNQSRWTLAIGTGDLNQDGFTDLYVANDFGPDELYFNEGGKGFRLVRGKFFGSVSRDTYKGMNASVADLDRNGWLDVYVSNVHHDMQAEGSLAWMFSPPAAATAGDPRIEDRATGLGILNERRFGWGAAVGDFDNDGWSDIAQANGMVDDSIDRRYEKCPDYWYVNEKIARSPPWIHRYTNAWGDIRGMCIHGTERNRLYLNRGAGMKPQFVDASAQLGMTYEGNSRGMAAVDLDNDGRLDLVVTHLYTGPTIYRNEPEAGLPSSPSWIGFELKGDGKTCNSRGIGSTVRISYSDAAGKPVTQMREAQVVDGLDAQNDRRIHFGLGAAHGPVSVTVDWCGRKKQSFDSVRLNAYQELRMSAP